MIYLIKSFNYIKSFNKLKLSIIALTLSGVQGVAKKGSKAFN